MLLRVLSLAEGIAAALLLVMPYSAAVAQGAQPVAATQCATNDNQITLCARNLEHCSVAFGNASKARNTAQTEVDRLRGVACMPANEPQWRVIVEKAIEGRLSGLLQTATPSNCQEFKYFIEANGKVVFEGKLRDRAPVQTAKSELLRALPGLTIDDEKVKLLPGECGIGIAGFPGHTIESNTPRRRDDLGDDRMRRAPPHTECAAIGAGIDKSNPEQRDRLAKGVWVMKEKLWALCQKSTSSSDGKWEVVTTNLESGVVILRETE